MTTNLTALYGLGGSGGGCKWKSQTFTTSGLWSRPEGVEVVRVLLVGGGGSGGIGSGRVQYGNGGGNSQFGSVVAQGGGGGGPHTRIALQTPYNAYTPGGVGGGVGTGIISFATTNLAQDGGYDAIISYPDNIQNGIFHGAMGVPSPFGITGAGGGGLGGKTVQGGSGGNVPGLGKGGAGYNTGFVGAGGGASYGNGGNGNGGNGQFGGGGGGARIGTGGGGGEIVFRDVPVTSDQVVVIGSGGASISYVPIWGTSTQTYVSGAGGNGLCIVYWIE